MTKRILHFVRMIVKQVFFQCQLSNIFCQSCLYFQNLFLLVFFACVYFPRYWNSFLAKVKYTFKCFHSEFIHPWFRRKFHSVRHENIFELENYFLWLKACFTIRLFRHRLHLVADCCWYLGMGNLGFLEPDHLLHSEYHLLNCKNN